MIEDELERDFEDVVEGVEEGFLDATEMGRLASVHCQILNCLEAGETTDAKRLLTEEIASFYHQQFDEGKASKPVQTFLAGVKSKIEVLAEKVPDLAEKLKDGSPTQS